MSHRREPGISNDQFNLATDNGLAASRDAKVIKVILKKKGGGECVLIFLHLKLNFYL